MDVHLRDLRYFVAVAEELHFSRAAERLFVSQPALSKQIRQLERSLRVDLFERDRRAVALTAAGEALQPHACELLRLWDDARTAAARAAATESATLTIGLVTSVGRDILSPTSRRFAERHPSSHLQMRQIAWHDPTAGLADGETDVAFVWLPLPDPASFAWEPLASEPRWVALPVGHRLAGQEEVTLEELLEEPFLALPSSAGPLRDFWLATEERGGQPAHVAAEVASADATFEAVAGGVGVALVAAGNAKLYQHDGVVSRPVVALGPATLAVARRADDGRELVADFVTACRIAVKGRAAGT
ncbi:MAG: LysR family transcriptional regulator [Actinomycetota bacterium]|nr:LysR family transcriptional regulator [Actinomycetota bacterium]